MATAYAANVGIYGALSTTAPGSSAGTEVSGGAPAYARLAPAWGAASAGAITTTAASAFNVPASTTVVGYEFYTAVTAGTYEDGATITSQTFASQGVYSITPTFTQS
jgi:hypothetical protein